jgi:hypothetical protein
MPALRGPVMPGLARRPTTYPGRAHPFPPDRYRKAPGVAPGAFQRPPRSDAADRRPGAGRGLGARGGCGARGAAGGAPGAGGGHRARRREGGGREGGGREGGAPHPAGHRTRRGTAPGGAGFASHAEVRRCPRPRARGGPFRAACRCTTERSSHLPARVRPWHERQPAPCDTAGRWTGRRWTRPDPIGPSRRSHLCIRCKCRRRRRRGVGAAGRRDGAADERRLLWSGG